MLAPAAPTANIQAQRVRCRQIAPNDLAELADLLARGFGRVDHTAWTRGLDRIGNLPPVEGLPRFGYALESEGTIVGALLLISSIRPGGRIMVNLSSWYVEPAWRAHSTLLASMATKLKHVTYLNASPAPHTWRTLQALGFKPFNLGRSAAFPVLGIGGGTISDAVPDDLPEREMLLAHRGFGAVSLTCEKNGVTHPFIFKPRFLGRPKVKMMELIYCRRAEDFAACGAALGRHFLKRGVLGFILDGRIAGMPSHYVAGKEPRFYKGLEAPPLNDLAFTEKVIFE